MPKYFIEYGNYIYKHTNVIEADTEDDALKAAYELALEICEDTEGQRGFGSREEFREDDPEAHEDEINEQWQEYVEDHAMYSAELFNLSIHNDCL